MAARGESAAAGEALATLVNLQQAGFAYSR